MIPRKKRNSSKVNLTISAVFHGALIIVIAYFAAREGWLGKNIQKLTVTLVPKEKKPEPPKEKPPEPKVEQAKQPEAPKNVAAAPKPEPVTAPPPVADAAPAAAAPAPVSLPAFDFSDGAKEVNTLSGPNDIYKAKVERALLANWNRPEDMEDATFAAEVQVNLDTTGKLVNYTWLNGSDNTRWDGSVKAALSKTKGFSKPPPGFPPQFKVRFDVESLKSAEVQLSSR